MSVTGTACARDFMLSFDEATVLGWSIVLFGIFNEGLDRLLLCFQLLNFDCFSCTNQKAFTCNAGCR